MVPNTICAPPHAATLSAACATHPAPRSAASVRAPATARTPSNPWRCRSRSGFARSFPSPLVRYARQVRLDKSGWRVVPAVGGAHRNATPDGGRWRRAAAGSASGLLSDLTQQSVDRGGAHRHQPVRTSGASCRWPCRSIASTRIGIRGRSRLPQTRSDASQTTIGAAAPPVVNSPSGARDQTNGHPGRHAAAASRACGATPSPP